MPQTPDTAQPNPAADNAVPAAQTVIPAGELLRQAREAKGLSVAAIATQMNLDMRTVEALERGDQARLPAPIFVRGYLRSFARLVGASENDVLQAYQAHAPAEPVPQRVGMPSATRRHGFRLPAIPWRGLFITALLAGLVFVGIEFGPKLVARFMSGEQAAEPAALPLPTPADGSSVRDGGSTLSLPAAGNEIELALPVPGTGETDMAQTDVPSETGTLDVAPDSEVLSSELIMPSELAAEPELPPEALTEPLAPAADRVRMEIRFSDDSWVEIRAADGSKLMYGLIRAGTTRTLEGRAPVSFLIGNARAVELNVNGKPFDLKSRTRGKVARFTLDATQ